MDKVGMAGVVLGVIKRGVSVSRSPKLMGKIAKMPKKRAAELISRIDAGESIAGVSRKHSLELPNCKINVIRGLTDSGERYSIMGIIGKNGERVVLKPNPATDAVDMFYRNCTPEYAKEAAAHTFWALC